MTEIQNTSTSTPKLERSLNLTLLIFYGLGTTIGAGIYVLIGAAAGHAGMYAPMAFVLAALGLVPTAMSYSELSGRFPVSAGEAVFVDKGFNSKMLSQITGWLVIISGIVASATISIGCAGYLSTFVNLPLSSLIIGVIILMALVAIWGIMESVLLAAMFTIIEAGGLIVLIIFGLNSEYVEMDRIAEIVPSLSDGALLFGIFNAGLLAVFAFIGFEDMVNVAEETKNPKKTMPRAIFFTLLITTILYTLVTIVAVFTIPPQELANSEAPLSMVFEKLTGASPIYISAIAIFATANTILVQFIMVSRVIYGMAEKGKSFLKIFRKVNAKTQTPILATILVALITILLAVAFPLERLAELTSQAILMVWLFVNIALYRLKRITPTTDPKVYVTPTWIPIVGALFCLLMLLMSFIG